MDTAQLANAGGRVRSSWNGVIPTVVGRRCCGYGARVETFDVGTAFTPDPPAPPPQGTPAAAAVGAAAEPISAGLIWLMTIACAMAVSNLYLNQPLLPDMAKTLQVTERQIGLVATAAQVGYALGILLFVPLGDIVERRRLILIMLVSVSLFSVGEALATDLLSLTAMSLGIGMTTVTAQIILPFGAELAGPGQRGKVIGHIMGGLLTGILLARTVAGFVGAYWGWRAMYWVAAAMSLGLAVTLMLGLPRRRPAANLRWGRLVASIWALAREHAELREASLIGGLLFGSFSAFWTTLAFLLKSPAYHSGSQLAGAFGLIGASGAVAAPIAGRLADRRGPRFVVGLAAIVTLLSFVVYLYLGATHLWGLIAGVVLMDMGVQAGQVSNQTRIYSLSPTAQSRVNTVYMSCYFVGGSVGSAMGTYAWSLWGWNGVCGVGLGF